MKRISIILAVFIVCAAAIVSVRLSRSSDAATRDVADYDFRDGKKEADADIARGTPKWKVSGRVSDAGEHAARLKRLGIELDWFADCFATEGIVRYRYEYNSTIRSHFVSLVGEETTNDVIGRPPIDDRQKKG